MMKLYEIIENNNFDEIDQNRAIELIQTGNGHLVVNQTYMNLEQERNNYKELYEKEKGKYKEVIDKAINIAYEYGQIDGDHHKMWVIDQMLRALLDEKYQDFIKDYEEDGVYTWDTGIAP